jgi:hypothetical protein
MIKSAELQWVRHVALFMSGGVDSTILCWRLNQLSIEYGFNFTLLTVENQLNYEQNVRAIILSGYLAPNPNLKWSHSIDNGKRFDGVIDGSILRTLMSREYDLVYTGVNQNPPHEIQNRPQRITPEKAALFHKLRCPFIELTKDVIFKFYTDNGLMGLYELTHSCTGMPVGECGACFQCVEKKWAETMNNYVRTKIC